MIAANGVFRRLHTPYVRSLEVQSVEMRWLCLSPFGGIMSRGHVPMKRRPRPICRVSHIPVLDRIEMDVIEMLFQIVLVSDDVFVIATLPDTAMTARLLRWCDRFLVPARREPVRGEFVLDRLPSRGVVAVAGRKNPQTVEVVPQQHGREQFKGMFGLHLTKRMAQQLSRRSDY